MKKTKKVSERTLFLKRFLANPRGVGSIIPSSPFLTDKMVRKDDLHSCRSVAELGAGTGIFTKHIIRNKSKKCSFYVFERDTAFSDILKSKFPNLQLYSEAALIGELAKKGEIRNPDLIISGIPFAVLKRDLRMKILTEVYEVLPAGGKFITFQYSTDLLKDLRSLYGSVKLEFVLFNIPPAIVYRCTK